MKTILLASALMVGSVAYAQADPSRAGQPIGSGASLQPGTTMGERDTHGSNMPAAPAASGTSTMSSDATATGSTMSTDTTASGSTMTDQSSMGATGTTMGTTGSGTVTVQQGGNMTAPAEPRANYPRCSRTVTDNCVQDESRARDTRRTRR